jgi:hypothetical protein
MEHALNEQDRARLYFIREQINDRIVGKGCSEDLRLVASTVHGNMPDIVWIGENQ